MPIGNHRKLAVFYVPTAKPIHDTGTGPLTSSLTSLPMSEQFMLAEGFKPVIFQSGVPCADLKVQDDGDISRVHPNFGSSLVERHVGHNLLFK